VSNERHARDTKGIHGKYGTIRIAKALEQLKILNATDDITSSPIVLSQPALPKEYKNRFCFGKELSLQGIMKKKDKKLKNFDFIIFYNCEPRFLIETNFYSTSGTKIGINQGEYVELLDVINDYNKKNGTKLLFCWITDGNYWLVKHGENRFKNLKENFFKGDFELLNYNIFTEKLPLIMEAIKDA
jgi:hypothetical protein